MQQGGRVWFQRIDRRQGTTPLPRLPRVRQSTNAPPLGPLTGGVARGRSPPGGPATPAVDPLPPPGPGRVHPTCLQNKEWWDETLLVSWIGGWDLCSTSALPPAVAMDR